MNYEAIPGMEDALRLVMEKAKKGEEKKKDEKPKRWWDDDGDGIGYEKGEVKKEEVELDEAGKAFGGGEDPCWKGYKQVGMKDKNGKQVPNCVPANEELQAIEDQLVESGLFTADEIHVIVGEKWEELEEATAMAKRGLDEPAIRQKIAKSTGGGEAADRASKLEKKSTYGDANKAKQRQNLARAQRGDFRKTTSSSPGLHGYAHKSNDPAVKAKQAARGAQRGALTPQEKKDLGR